MRDGYYYFEVRSDIDVTYRDLNISGKHFYLHITANLVPHIASFLVEHSNKVWLQGTRGGVKLIKDRTFYCDYGYVTSDSKRMEEFTIVKLQSVAADDL